MVINSNRNEQHIWNCENINDNSKVGKFRQFQWVSLYGICVFIFGFIVTAISLNVLTGWNFFEEPLSPNIFVSLIGASLSFLTYILFTIFVAKQCTKDKLIIHHT